MKRFVIDTEITEDMSTTAIVDAIMLDLIPSIVEPHNAYVDNRGVPSLILSTMETGFFLEDLINSVLNREVKADEASNVVQP